MSDPTDPGARAPAAAPQQARAPHVNGVLSAHTVPAPALERTAPPAPQLVPESPAETALRAEHDALAERVAVRRSVDSARRGFQLLFVGFLGVLLSGKLAWDRWGVLPPGVTRTTPPGIPLYLYVAMACTVVVLAFSIRAFLTSRRLGREEDAIFARVLALRAELGLDR
jgi:hypothetical protein